MTKRANDFLIWRAGTSVGWDCTQQEIADEVGFSVQKIGETCRRRGWVMDSGAQKSGYVGDRRSTDTLMKSPYIAGRAET